MKIIKYNIILEIITNIDPYEYSVLIIMTFMLLTTTTIPNIMTPMIQNVKL